MGLKIFKESSLSELNQFIKSDNFEFSSLTKDKVWALEYFNYLGVDEDEYLFETNVDFKLNKELVPRVSSDFDSAILLYENFKLTEVQAVDERLWSYLSLVELWEYTFERWLSKDDKKTKTFLDRGILNPNARRKADRKFLRNSISRLWWGVHATVCEEEDKYRFTKILFSNQDIFLQILERSYSKSPSVLKALLEYIDIMKNKNTLTRAHYRLLLKEVTRLSGVILIDIISQEEMLQLLMQSDELKEVFTS
jgi:hypothetical protein